MAENQQGGVFQPDQPVSFTNTVSFSSAPSIGAATIVSTTATQTLTNKTLTSPTIATPTITAPAVTGAYTLAPIVITASADGALTITATSLTIVNITKGSAAALTIADPAAGLNGAIVVLTAQTAHAHTLVNTTGFNAGGAGSDTGTWGGAIGDGIVIIAINTKWNVVIAKNVTLG